MASARKRDQPALPGIAEGEEVGGDGIAQQRRGNPSGVDEVGAIRHGTRRDLHPHGFARQQEIGIAGELGRHHLMLVDDGMGALARGGGQDPLGRRGDEVAAENEIGPARRDADGSDARRTCAPA